jgi:hypothetical protein
MPGELDSDALSIMKCQDISIKAVNPNKYTTFEKKEAREFS